MTLPPGQVQISSGRLRGSERGGVLSFKGIPYGQAPEGELRFQPPRPAKPWTGVYSATRPGPVPIQPAIPLFRFLNAGAARQSEDCLYLNVWTPGLGRPRRPVLVWIHGGGFLVGSGSTPVYDGKLLARTGDLVVVTINYRLGALGYVHLDGLQSGGLEQSSNLGTRDQIAALQWVRENIAEFGGDPENVTVCGQSAGAMSVAALLGAPSARGLFRRAILQSGAGGHVVHREKADMVAERFLHALGDPPCTAADLGKLPVPKILEAQGRVNRELTNSRDLMVMAPCVDGELITEFPLEAIRKGSASHISMMIGTTLDEWKLFTAAELSLIMASESRLVERFAELLPQVTRNSPRPEVAARSYRAAVRERGGRTSPLEVWSAFQSMRVFHHPAAELAECHQAAGGEVHSYLFSWRPAAFSRSLGACHAMELPFVFGLAGHSLTRAITGFAPSARKLSARMQNAWIEFVRSGNPAHGGLPEWDLYDSASRATMVFDRECSLADQPLNAERNLLSAWI